MYVCMYVCMYVYIVCMYVLYVSRYVYLNVIAEQNTYVRYMRIPVRVRDVWRSPWSVLLLCCQGWRPD
jgi:hypothetical protein